MLLGVQRLPLLFSRYSVRTKNSSICRYILDVLVRIGEFNILLFSHLDPTPPKNVLSTSSLLAQKDIQTHLTLFTSIRRIRHFFMESLLLSVENGFPFSRSVVSDCDPTDCFPASGSFPMNQFFTSGGQSIRASASVLPMNIQD